MSGPIAPTSLVSAQAGGGRARKKYLTVVSHFWTVCAQTQFIRLHFSRNQKQRVAERDSAVLSQNSWHLCLPSPSEELYYSAFTKQANWILCLSSGSGCHLPTQAHTAPCAYFFFFNWTYNKDILYAELFFPTALLQVNTFLTEEPLFRLSFSLPPRSDICFVMMVIGSADHSLFYLFQ